MTFIFVVHQLPLCLSVIIAMLQTPHSGLPLAVELLLAVM